MTTNIDKQMKIVFLLLFALKIDGFGTMIQGEVQSASPCCLFHQIYFFVPGNLTLIPIDNFG